MKFVEGATSINLEGFGKGSIPKNLEGCLDEIFNYLTQQDIDRILDPKSDPEHEHFKFGMRLRTEWKLWETNSPLVKWFEKTYGLSYGDDICRIILDCLWRDIRNQSRRAKQLSDHFLQSYEHGDMFV
jgi:hypothetical protein